MVMGLLCYAIVVKCIQREVICVIYPSANVFGLVNSVKSRFLFCLPGLAQKLQDSAAPIFVINGHEASV